MRGQVTFDAVFALFLVVFALLFLSVSVEPAEDYKVLEINRKITDLVLFIVEDESLAPIAEGNYTEISEVKKKLSHLKNKLELDGIEVNVKGTKIRVGTERELKISKKIIIPAYDSQEFIIGEVSVW